SIGTKRDLDTRTGRDAGFEHLDPALVGAQGIGQRRRARDRDGLDALSAGAAVVDRHASAKLTVIEQIIIAAFTAIERVVATTAEEYVIPCTAGQRIVAGAADQDIVSGAAGAHERLPRTERAAIKDQPLIIGNVVGRAQRAI